METISVKKITYTEAKTIVKDWDHRLKRSGWGNDWHLGCHNYDFYISKVKSKEPEYIYVAYFAVIPVKHYKVYDTEYVTVELIMKNKNEYLLLKLNMVLNEYLDKTRNPEWLRDMNIDDRPDLRKYLKISLHAVSEDYEHILEKSDIWDIVKTKDERTVLRAKFDNTNPAKIELNVNNFLNILDFLHNEWNKEIKSNLIILILYMLMSQFNMPITFFRNPVHILLNVGIGENNYLKDILLELADCINIASAGENQSDVTMPHNFKISNQNKYDYIFVSDADELNSIQDILSTKDIPNGKLNCKAILISKEKLADDKYFYIDLTECKFGEDILSKLKLSRELLKCNLKKFYIHFANYQFDYRYRVGKNEDNSRNFFDIIDDIISEEYHDMEKDFGFDIINFCVCLQVFFLKYLEYLKVVTASYIQDYELLANEIFRNMIQKMSSEIKLVKTAYKAKNDIECILENVYKLIEEDNASNKTKHFINKSDYENGIKCDGFYHNIESDTGAEIECICLTEKWLGSIVNIKDKKLKSSLKSAVLAGEYNASFQFTPSDKSGQVKVSFYKNKELPTRYFTVSIDNLKNWVAENEKVQI